MALRSILFNSDAAALAAGVELSNAVAGAEVAVPVPTALFFPVLLEFTEKGILRLPPREQVPFAAEYHFCRKPGGTSTTNMAVISATAPDVIDGRAGVNSVNSPVYIDLGDSNGMGVRVRNGKHCWHAVGGALACEQIVLAVATTIKPWSGLLNIGAGAAGATHTLPELGSVMGEGPPRGMMALIYATQTSTFQRAGADVFVGSLNGTDHNGATSFTLNAGQSAIIMPVSANAWFVH